MVNRWTLYQALACRMWARSALYQSERRVRLPRPAAGRDGVRLRRAGGGARAHPARRGAPVRRGRRAALVASAQRARRAHASSPTTSPGCPYVVDHYVRVTGDAAVLDEVVPFLTMRELEPDEHEVYDLPQVSRRDGDACTSTACARCARPAPTGAHGLPLIGIGDWNDGMNRVGVEGRGESVWLAWFLDRDAARRSPSTCDARGDAACAVELRAQADALRRRRWRRTAGTASGTAAPTSTTARRSARRRTTSAASTRSRRAGA